MEYPNEIKKEQVNHPYHYQRGIEPIEVIESWGLNFSLGNAIKYILRSPYKGKQIEDLEKARWYLDREIERLKNKENKGGAPFWWIFLEFT